mgnify:CR=1 FL=1
MHEKFATILAVVVMVISNTSYIVIRTLLVILRVVASGPSTSRCGLFIRVGGWGDEGRVVVLWVFDES